MKESIKCTARCVHPVSKDGEEMGFAVDGEDGVTYRFMMPVADARSMAESMLDYLEGNDLGEGVSSKNLK